MRLENGGRRMSFAGDLRGIGLSDVFQNVAANRITGTLCVRARRDERFVRFEVGAVTGFSIGMGRGCAIVEHLVARRVVVAADLERLLARHKRSRRSPVSLLVEKELIDVETLRAAVTERIQEGVFELFSMRDAEFSFEEGEPPARVFETDLFDLEVRLDVGPLLMEAARRADESERIQKIVATPDDLFVLLEGWESLVADDAQACIAPLLDGRTPVCDVISGSALIPFMARKAIHDLVQSGAARACTPEELVAVADDAEVQGDVDGATNALRAALRLTPGDREQRVRYAALLERSGHNAEGAMELARLGHDAAREDDIELAIEHYRAAVALAPEETPLQERLVELVGLQGDGAALTTAMLELVAQFRAMGLAERARQLLSAHVETRASMVEPVLVATLADIEADLGHSAEAARLFHALGERVSRRDEGLGLTYLRAALRHAPDNDEIAALIRDLDSGRAARRRVRRRRILWSSAALLMLASVGVTSGAEMIAARRASAALGHGLGSVDDGRAIAALTGLQAVRDDYGWTPSGRRAHAWIDRLIDLQLEAVRARTAAGDYGVASSLCTQLAAATPRGDVRATCLALRARIDRERRALAILRRADRPDLPPTAEELAELETLAAPEHLDFLLARAPLTQDPRVRVALLTALGGIDSARSVLPAVQAALTHPDGATLVAVDAILARVADWRRAGRAQTWEPSRRLLEEAREDPRRGAVARRLSAVLFP